MGTPILSPLLPLHKSKGHHLTATEYSLRSPPTEKVVIVAYLEHQTLSRILCQFPCPPLSLRIPLKQRMHINELLLAL